jgi:hypothetical protein
VSAEFERQNAVRIKNQRLHRITSAILVRYSHKAVEKTPIYYVPNDF